VVVGRVQGLQAPGYGDREAFIESLADPDRAESRGALSTVIPVDDFPPDFSQLAISATRSLGLPFGGVDLAIENGGVVFEVNVHPVLDVPGGLETLAIPFVQAHLPPQ
jgi:hypothetical protein